MNVAFRNPMSREEFFAWAQAQNERYEFDGFQPVAMTSGNLGHSVIAGNITRELGNRLVGKKCRTLGPDAGVGTIGQTVRYPDNVVTCSPFTARDSLVPNPVIVFEVVSPTSIRMDHVTKRHEYQAVATIRRYIIVESDAMTITVHCRDHGGGTFREADRANGEILHLPEIDIEMPVAKIYEGMNFAPLT